MTIQSRRRRRLAILALVLLLAGGALAGMYARRQHQIEEAAKARRSDGMAAAAQQRDALVLDHLGPYLRRNDKDVEALYAYACSRRRIEAPRGRHLVEAMGILQRVVDLAPQHAEARRDLLDLYSILGYNHETIDLADAILRHNPQEPVAWRAKAVALARMRQHEKAAGAVEKCLELRPFDAQAAILRLDLRQQQGATGPQLIEAAKAHRRQHPRSPIADLHEAYAHRLAGDAATSVELLRAAAAGPISDESHVVMLVMLLDDSRLSEESMAVLEKASKTIVSPTIAAELARRLWESNRHEELVSRLASVDATRRDSSDLLLGLRAASLYELGRRDEAKAITAALEARGADSIGSAWARVLDSAYGARQGKPQAVVAACVDAQGIDPSNAYFAYIQGAAWWSMGETDLALASWKTAAKHRPNWITPRISTVHALLSAGQTELAQREARAAIERTPHRVDAIAAWVVAHATTLAGEDKERAQQLLTAAAAVQRAAPYEPQTLPLYIELHALCGKPEIAAERLRQVLAKAPALDEAAWLKLAAVSRTHGLKLEAECYAQIEKKSGATPGLTAARANDLAAQGQIEAGKQLIFKTAASQPDRHTLAWQMAIGRYLDQVNDPAALDHWIKLANEHAQDARVQSWAMQTRCVQRDSAAQDRLIERLRELSGPRAVTWRLARAQKLLANDATSQSATEAAALLQGVVNDAPTSLSAQVLLARSLERMNLDSRASAQIVAAARVQPQSVDLALEAARMLSAQHDFAGARAHLLRLAGRADLDSAVMARVAALLARQGDDAVAIRMLDQADQTHPLSDNQLLLLGALARRQGDKDRVASIIRRLLDRSTAAGIEFAADYQASIGDLPEARRLLARLGDITVSKAERASILARHEQRFGTAEKAVDHLRQAVDADPSQAQSHRALITQYLRLGQTTEAMAALDAAQKATPTNAALQDLCRRTPVIQWAAAKPAYLPLLLAMVQEESQQGAAGDGLDAVMGLNMETRTAVLARLRALCLANIDCLPLVTVTVQLHIQHGRAEEGLAVAGEALAAHPTAWEPAWIRCEALGALERWDETLVTAQEWRRRAGADKLAADLMIAEAHYRLNRPADSARQLTDHMARAKAEPDKHGDLLWSYARAQLASNHADIAAQWLLPLCKESKPWRLRVIDLALQPGTNQASATSWLDRVAATLPADALTERTRLAATWIELATRFKSADCRRRADRLLEEMTQSPAASAEQWFLLGLVGEQDADLPRAESAYRAALKLSPKMAPACNNLAMLLAADARGMEEALELAGKAVAAAPQSPGYLDTLAYVQHRMQRHDEAAASARKAVELQPENPRWRTRLANVTAPREGTR